MTFMFEHVSLCRRKLKNIVKMTIVNANKCLVQLV
uniref:Uncharacterized protein n=1 Tax=Anopheles dirus TaxID=7168 RepID=A0A182NWA3_9DIPT